MIEDLFEEAVRSDEHSRARLIRELASYPDEALSPILNALQGRSRHRWQTAAQVIRAIGYPRSTIAIPILIYHVGYLNSARSSDAIGLLTEMDVQVVVPYLIQKLLARDRSQHWGEEVKGIFQLIFYAADQEYVLQCGTAVAYLLGREDLPPPDDLDRGVLLDVLEKVGSDCANYALPTLIDFVYKEGMSKEGMQAQRLIGSFSEEARAPYALVLASLEETTEGNEAN